MLLAVGVVPFLGAALLAARLRRRGEPARAALGACTVSVITAAGLALPAAPGRLGYHLQVLGGGLLDVFGLAWPALLASLLPLAWLPAAWRSGRPELAAHAAYWALAEILLAAAFVLSALPSEFGPPAARYLVPFFYAAVATTPVWASGPSRRQAAVGAAAAAFCLASAFQLAQTDFGGDAGREQLIDSLRQRGLTRGYASYWTAAPVAWNTGLGLRVAPVTEDPARPDEQCGEPICPFAYNSLSGWYRPQPGTRTFVVTHPNVDYMRRPPPASLGPPLEVFQAGGYTVYVFADDVAARMPLPPRFTRPLF